MKNTEESWNVFHAFVFWCCFLCMSSDVLDVVYSSDNLFQTVLVNSHILFQRGETTEAAHPDGHDAEPSVWEEVWSVLCGAGHCRAWPKHKGAVHLCPWPHWMCLWACRLCGVRNLFRITLWYVHCSHNLCLSYCLVFPLYSGDLILKHISSKWLFKHRKIWPPIHSVSKIWTLETFLCIFTILILLTVSKDQWYTVLVVVSDTHNVSLPNPMY